MSGSKGPSWLTSLIESEEEPLQAANGLDKLDTLRETLSPLRPLQKQVILNGMGWDVVFLPLCT